MANPLARIPTGIRSVRSPVLRNAARNALSRYDSRLSDPSTQPTAAQQELIPYIEEEAKKEANKRGLLRPVEFIFDILQRGQYLTANIAQAITDNVRGGKPIAQGLPRAVVGAISGRVKGDWKDVLFGGPDEQGRAVQGLFDWRPETKGGKFAKNLAGFAANVLLDPTTYLSFGSSTAAKQSATRFADDGVVAFIRKLTQNPKEYLPELIRKGIDDDALKAAGKLGDVEALQYLQQVAGDDITKIYSRLHRELYEKAVRLPNRELTEELRNKVIKDVSGFARKHGVENLPAAPAGRKLLETTALEPRKPTLPSTEVVASRAVDPIKFNQDLYSASGTRAWRFMRKEFGLKESYPGWLRRMDEVKQKFRKSGIGGKFSDAWWSFMNHSKSPVATLRKSLRIRNPYQKLLAVMERDVQERAFHGLLGDGEKINAIAKGLNDEEARAVTGAMMFSQVQQEKAKAARAAIKKKFGEAQPLGHQYAEAMRTQAEGLQEPVTLSAREIAQKFAPEESVDKVVSAIDEINKVSDEWLQFNRDAYERGLSSSIGEWEDYLPIQSNVSGGWQKPGRQLAGMQPAYTHARELGVGGHVQQQVEKLRWMFGEGISDEQVAAAIANNFSDLNVNLQEMLTRRAFAQARFRQRVHLLDSFKQFGVDIADIKEVNPQLYNSIAGKWGDLNILGMGKVNDPALEGIIFDQDVADIFGRAIQVTHDGTAWDKIVSKISDFTSWWRGWATLSPGFHMRNFISNNMTGYLKHGMEWFDPQTYTDALIMTHVALHGKEKAIQNLGKAFGDDVVRARIARRIGDYTLEELAEYAGTKGIATRVTRGFHQPRDYEELTKVEGRLFEKANWNPMSRTFTPMDVSHSVGSYVESSSRLQSFLLDFKRGVSQGADQKSALEWAKREAKKWFIDYGDLSKTEREGLRNILPFYSWLRGNIANQISGLAMMPEMYGTIAKGLSAADTGGVSREEMPEWARELGMIPVGPAEDDKTRFFWPNFPIQDLNKIPMRFSEQGAPIPYFSRGADIIADIASDSHPVLKTIIEVATNKDVFYQNDIGDLEKAPRALRMLTAPLQAVDDRAPQSVVEFLDGMLRHVGFDQGIRAEVDDKGRLLLDGRMAKVLENNLLMLNMIPKYADIIDVFIPAVERWKEKTFHSVDDYDALEEFFQVLSFYVGIKFKDIDIEESEFYRKYNITKEAQAQRSQDQRRTPGAEQRSLDWRQQQEGTFRRLGL